MLPLTRFVVGANLPWVGYGTDIGTSLWYPAGGLNSQPASVDLLAATFAKLARDGISLLRTFLLCDLRSGVRFDSRGVPTGLDDAVFLDIDTLVSFARQHQVQLMPVLLDFHLCGFAHVVNGVQLGGRSRLIEDPVARSALVDLVLRSIVQQYREEETIVAWDIMNEPEWCLAIGPSTIERVTFHALQVFLRRLFDPAIDVRIVFRIGRGLAGRIGQRGDQARVGRGLAMLRHRIHRAGGVFEDRQVFDAQRERRVRSRRGRQLQHRLDFLCELVRKIDEPAAEER